MEKINQKKYSLLDVLTLLYDVKKELLKIADAGEYEDMRREVEAYFKDILPD